MNDLINCVHARPFAQRYLILLALGRGTYKPVDVGTLDQREAAELARRILQAAKLEGWQIGKSRVFLRAGQLAALESARGRRLTVSALVIQVKSKYFELQSMPVQ